MNTEVLERRKALLAWLIAFLASWAAYFLYRHYYSLASYLNNWGLAIFLDFALPISVTLPLVLVALHPSATRMGLVWRVLIAPILGFVVTLIVAVLIVWFCLVSTAMANPHLFNRGVLDLFLHTPVVLFPILATSCGAYFANTRLVFKPKKE